MKKISLLLLFLFNNNILPSALTKFSDNLKNEFFQHCIDGNVLTDNDNDRIISNTIFEKIAQKFPRNKNFEYQCNNSIPSLVKDVIGEVKTGCTDIASIQTATLNELFHNNDGLIVVWKQILSNSYLIKDPELEIKQPDLLKNIATLKNNFDEINLTKTQLNYLNKENKKINDEEVSVLGASNETLTQILILAKNLAERTKQMPFQDEEFSEITNKVSQCVKYRNNANENFQRISQSSFQNLLSGYLKDNANSFSNTFIDYTTAQDAINFEKQKNDNYSDQKPTLFAWLFGFFYSQDNNHASAFAKATHVFEIIINFVRNIKDRIISTSSSPSRVVESADNSAAMK